MSFQESGGHIAAKLLLRRIEQELAGCRAILVRVETAVETLLKSGDVAADDPLHIVEMQNLDLLDQILADVMLCLQDMGSSDAIAATRALRLGDVTRRLRLAALRNRLAGHATIANPGNGVELF